MAQSGRPPRKIVRKTAPVEPLIPRVPRADAPGRGTPARPITGRLLAVLLGGLFVALVLVIAVKAFGAAGHPMLGLLVGLACLTASGLIYWKTSREN